VEALHCLERWLKIAPESVRALDWHGWVCNQLDQHERAILDYKHVLELQPDRSAVRLRLADLFVETNHCDEALPLLEQVRREQPDNPLVLVDLARCWAAQSQTEEAENLLDLVLVAHPTYFDALFQRGKLEKERNHLVEAEHWLRKALVQKPCNPEVRYTLFQCLQAQTNRQAEAREEEVRWREDTKARDRLLLLLRTQVDQRANDPDLAGEVGELLLRQGEEPWGLFWLHRALTLDPRQVSSHRALMAYYERTNDLAKAAYHRQQLVAAGKK
jgi:tetratricopeptide (TPR) repeat protein